MNSLHKETYSLCLVFPMGIEAYPFLKRVETRHRSKIGKAILRECFFEGERFLVLRSGIGPERAAKAVRSMPSDVRFILSVGTAGALSPELRLGQIVVVSETINANQTDQVVNSEDIVVNQLVKACLHSNEEHVVRRVATNNRAVFSQRSRLELNRSTLASAVDMESHAIALEAQRRGSAFGGLRVISDTLESDSLPQRVDFRALMKNPLQGPLKFASFLRWRKFMKQFFMAIGKLDPVLINFLRLHKRDGE